MFEIYLYSEAREGRKPVYEARSENPVV